MLLIFDVEMLASSENRSVISLNRIRAPREYCSFYQYLRHETFSLNFTRNSHSNWKTHIPIADTSFLFSLFVSTVESVFKCPSRFSIVLC